MKRRKKKKLNKPTQKRVFAWHSGGRGARERGTIYKRMVNGPVDKTDVERNSARCCAGKGASPAQGTLGRPTTGAISKKKGEGSRVIVPSEKQKRKNLLFFV